MRLKLKLQYFGHLIRRANSLEKTLKLVKFEGKRRRGQQRVRWLDGITNSMDTESESVSCSVMPTLCDPMDCNPPGFSVHEIFQARILGVGCHFLLQGIFPTQESNLGFLHCRQMLYPLSHQGSPKYPGKQLPNKI